MNCRSGNLMGSPLLNEALSSASRAERDKKGVLVRSKKQNASKITC